MAKEISQFDIDCFNEINDWNVHWKYREKCERTRLVIQEPVFGEVTEHWHFQCLDSTSYVARAYDILEREFLVKAKPDWFIFLSDTPAKLDWLNALGASLLTTIADGFVSDPGGEIGFFELHENSPAKFRSYSTSRALKCFMRVLRARAGSQEVDRRKALAKEIDSVLTPGSAKKIIKFAELGLLEALDRPADDEHATVEEIYRFFDILWSLGKIDRSMGEKLLCQLEKFRNKKDGGYVEKLVSGSESFTCSTHFALNIMELILRDHKGLRDDAEVKKGLHGSVEFIKGSYCPGEGLGGGFRAPSSDDLEESVKPESRPNLIHSWLCLRTLEAAYDKYLENEKHLFKKILREEWSDQLIILLQNCYEKTEGGSGFGATPNSIPSIYATDCGMSIIALLNRVAETIDDINKPFPGFSASDIYETLLAKHSKFTGRLTGWITPDKKLSLTPASS